MNPILGMLIMLELFAATSATVLAAIYLSRRRIARRNQDEVND